MLSSQAGKAFLSGGPPARRISYRDDLVHCSGLFLPHHRESSCPTHHGTWNQRASILTSLETRISSRCPFGIASNADPAYPAHVAPILGDPEDSGDRRGMGSCFHDAGGIGRRGADRLEHPRSCWSGLDQNFKTPGEKQIGPCDFAGRRPAAIHSGRRHQGWSGATVDRPTRPRAITGDSPGSQ